MGGGTSRRWAGAQLIGRGLPLTVEAVTPEWLGAVLGVRIASLRVRDMLSGTGTKLLLELDYVDDGARLPSRLCLKAGFAGHREAMLFLYQLEARFFAEIAPRLALRLPACFFAAADEAQGLVVMEDLTATGATICRVQQTLDFAQTADFLTALASLHARFWNSPELDDPDALGWLVRHDPLPDDDWGAYGRGQLDPATWVHYMSLPRAQALPARCRDRDRMHAALQALRRFGDSGPTCLIHADAHLGNLFVDADGRPGFLDWQSARKGHWAQDVAYFLVSALDPLDRRAWERRLVRHYLAELTRLDVPDAPEESQAWDAISAHIVYGLFYWMVNPVEWQAEVNNAAVAPRFAWAAVDHDAPPLNLLG